MLRFWRRFHLVPGVGLLCWWTSPKRCRLKLWDDVPVTEEQSAAHTPVTDVYEFQLPAEIDLFGPKKGLFQFTALSANGQLHILPHKIQTFIQSPSGRKKLQLQVLKSSLILQNFFMSSTQTDDCFSSLLYVVRTASCFLCHLNEASTSSVFLSIFSIILECFLLSLLPHSSSHWHTRELMTPILSFSGINCYNRREGRF